MSKRRREQLAPELERRIAEWQDKYLRLQAEFDNYRKRTLREKMELVERGGADVIKAMLPWPTIWIVRWRRWREATTSRRCAQASG